MTEWHATISRLGHELEMVNESLVSGVHRSCYRPYLFEQVWPDDLGFSSCRGDETRRAWTIVLLPTVPNVRALVYFGGRFAYEADMNENFQHDLACHRLVNIANSNRYRTKRESDVNG